MDSFSALTHSGKAMFNPFVNFNLTKTCLFQVGWGCRIHRLHLYKGIRLPNEYPGYDSKPSDGESPVMLEHWRMRSTPSLPSPPGPLWLGVVGPDKVLSMGQIELNYTYAELNCLK